MKATDVKTVTDVSNYIEGCLNDYEGGISTKEETNKHLHDLVTQVIEIVLKSRD